MKIIEIHNDEREPEIRVVFKHNEKEGLFYYDLAREEVISVDYEEGFEEDIYSIIHDWVQENVTWEVKIHLKREEDKILA